MMWDELSKALTKNLSSFTQISDMASALGRLQPTLSPAFLHSFKDLGNSWTLGSMESIARAIPRLQSTVHSSLFPQPRFPTFPFPKLPTFPLPKFPAFPFPKFPTASLDLAAISGLRSSALKIADASRNSFLSASLLPASMFHLPQPQIAGLTQALAAISARSTSQGSGISSTFVGGELAAIEEVGDAATLDQIEERFTTVENAIVEQIKRTPLVRISFEGWLNLLLTLFVFLYSTISSDTFQARLEGKVDMIARVDERILDSQKKIYEALSERMQDSDMTGVLYATLREASLKVKPFPKSRTSAFLFPNQVVRLEARKGKWILISYFDYVDATVRSGWVLKKYLRRVGR